MALVLDTTSSSSIYDCEVFLPSLNDVFNSIPFHRFGLMIASLLQVVNRLDASLLSRFLIHKLHCFNNLQQVCKHQVASSLFFIDMTYLDEINRLDAT